MAEELNPGAAAWLWWFRLETVAELRPRTSRREIMDIIVVRMKRETLNNINHQRQTREIVKAPDDLRSILWAVYSMKLKSEARSNKKKSPQRILGWLANLLMLVWQELCCFYTKRAMAPAVLSMYKQRASHDRLIAPSFPRSKLPVLFLIWKSHPHRESAMKA